MQDLAKNLLQISDYAIRQKKILQELVASDDCQTPLFFCDYQQAISHLQLNIPSQKFSQIIRQFRHYYLLRLILRELAGLADTRETMTSWSDCADVLILKVIQYCEFHLQQSYGKPRHQSGEEAKLYTLAMGKLGGRELNFSSDIDLIFAFSSAGYTDGNVSLSNEQYYIKIVQQFVQLLQQVTADGFVFRVDLRLRPNGESGALICSLAAMETYYQEQGRDWERYAMVKARLIGERGIDKQHWFNRLITPFVYRRYVDFSVIESLRSMKAMIEREVQLNPSLDDIKRGKGGIREVEFIIQSFQLIRGGRLIPIQQQNTMEALAALKQHGLLSHTVAIQKAYLFLRKLENTLQMLNDQQTHVLPFDLHHQEKVRLALGFASWDELLDKLHQYQRIINHAFHAILNKVDVYEDEKRLLAGQLAGVWQGHIEPTMATGLLTSIGFQNAERCYQLLQTFRQTPRCRRLSQAARMRLDRFMVLLMTELTKLKNTDEVLVQVLHLLENIVGRSAYLALLTENPLVLQELLHWFAHSPFITSLLVTQPFLLEVLVDQKSSWKPLSRKQLQADLQQQLAHCQDNEAHGERLRQFKLTCYLLAARAELYRQCDALRIGKFLADVAHVIILEVLNAACIELSVRHIEIMTIKAQFAIVAYGKLGSNELNYNSDVDLVFLHNVSARHENLVTRLIQKILTRLITRTQTGILYQVDTRLRPSGSAGLLVSHVDAFIDYQLNHAWVWEHQALLRARVLHASAYVKRSFYQLKRNILAKTYDKNSLRDAIKEMRAKIDKHLEYNEIKHGSGGLLDIEFLVQYLVLAYSDEGFVYLTNTLSQLKYLLKKQVLAQSEFNILKQAYCKNHHLLHSLILQPDAMEMDNKSRRVLCNDNSSSELPRPATCSRDPEILNNILMHSFKSEPNGSREQISRHRNINSQQTLEMMMRYFNSAYKS